MFNSLCLCSSFHECLLMVYPASICFDKISELINLKCEKVYFVRYLDSEVLIHDQLALRFGPCWWHNELWHRWSLKGQLTFSLGKKTGV